jgi:DnaJ-class molecular chaperone
MESVRCGNCEGTGKDPRTEDKCKYCDGTGTDNDRKFEKETEQAGKDRANFERLGTEVREKHEEYSKTVFAWIDSSLKGDWKETLRLSGEKERLLREANQSSNNFFEAYKKLFPEAFR